MTGTTPRFGAGRKPKAAGEHIDNFPHRITIKINYAQAQKLVDAAQARDVSVSAIIRELIDDHTRTLLATDRAYEDTALGALEEDA